MTPKESLYFALGEIAYAIAAADGMIQKEEEKQLHGILKSELDADDDVVALPDIAFHVMKRDKTDVETCYQWAMRQIKMNSHYLSPELKLAFLRVAEKVARVFSPVVETEKKLMERFRRDIAPIHGDPVFYAQ